MAAEQPRAAQFKVGTEFPQCAPNAMRLPIPCESTPSAVTPKPPQTEFILEVEVTSN